MTRQITWLRVLVEGVVIVGSILLAFGIQAWWEDRQAADLEGAFLVQLVEDLRRSEAQLASEAMKTEVAEQLTLNLLEVARGERGAPNDTLAAWLRGFGYFTDPRPTLSTPRALAESENLYVLRDPALRTAVTSMIDRVEQVQSRLIPFEQRVFAATRSVDRWVYPADRGLLLSVGMIDPAVDALRASEQGAVHVELLPVVRKPDLTPVFLDIFWSHENLLWYQRELVRATKELREAVEGVLAR